MSYDELAKKERDKVIFNRGIHVPIPDSIYESDDHYKNTVFAINTDYNVFTWPKKYRGMRPIWHGDGSVSFPEIK